jgi:hypothetical protein
MDSQKPPGPTGGFAPLVPELVEKRRLVTAHVASRRSPKPQRVAR